MPFPVETERTPRSIEWRDSGQQEEQLGREDPRSWWHVAETTLPADAAESEYFGQEAVRFYTRYKSVMQRWPDSIA